MESLSPSQITEINSLYHKIYEPEEELVEVYLNEDEIRSCVAYEIYRLTESHDHFSDDQLSAVIDILTEMNLNMQKAEQSISKIIGEDVSLTGTAVVLEEKEDLQEFLKTLTGYGLKGSRGPIMKFLSKQVNKIPGINPKRAIGSIRRNITNALGVNLANQADTATGSNVKGTLAKIGHGIAAQLNPMNFLRGYTNKKPGDK